MRVLVFVLTMSATVSLADSWHERAAAFRAKAASERQRLGLDAAKARQGYPTPEVRFGAGSAFGCPGETAVVMLEGKLAPGTLVGTASPEVEILKEELLPTGWRGTIRVKPGAKDRATFEIISPVSGITSRVELRIGCAREWVLDLASGERLIIKVVDGVHTAQGEWWRGGASLGRRAFELTVSEGTFNLRQVDTADERARKNARAGQADAEDLAQRQQQLAANLQSCQGLAPAQMGACMQQYTGELRELMTKQQKVVQQAQQAAAPDLGCRQVQGTVASKTLTGRASDCAGQKQPGQVPFSGVIR